MKKPGLSRQTDDSQLTSTMQGEVQDSSYHQANEQPVIDKSVRDNQAGEYREVVSEQENKA
jgi:hypothetical protein